jgi:hypothetical protein
LPSLREVQHAFAHALLGVDDGIGALVVTGGGAAEDRLRIHRDTFVAVASRALRLNHPAVERLVGTAFFASVAREYALAKPPAMAWLDAYGEGFAAFLGGLPSTAGVPYLADVARVEWAVSAALHAPDAAALDASALVSLAPEAQADLRFVAHPAVSLLRTETNADAIWRAVLERDEEALAAIDPGAGPRWLLVERTPEQSAAVVALSEGEWRLTSDLVQGVPLAHALAASVTMTDVDPARILAAHLAAGRFTAFEIPARRNAARDLENDA